MINGMKMPKLERRRMMTMMSLMIIKKVQIKKMKMRKIRLEERLNVKQNAKKKIKRKGKEHNRKLVSLVITYPIKQWDGVVNLMLVQMLVNLKSLWILLL